MLRRFGISLTVVFAAAAVAPAAPDMLDLLPEDAGLTLAIRNLNQLKKNYAENFETFIANAGVSMWFAPRDVTTSEYVSKLCGTKWELMESRSVGENPLAVAHGDRDPLESLHVGTGQQWQQISVMEPDAVRKLGRGQFIMFAENHREGHFIGSRQPYWLMPEFRGKFGQDPYHV